MTIPLGFLAQSHGRPLVLSLNILARIFMLSWSVAIGYLEVLPTKALVLGPTLSLLGGECVFNSIIYAIASDLADDPVNRATYFGYMSSVSYVVALLGPALASATMSVRLWLPFFIGICVLLLAMVIIPSTPSHISALPSHTSVHIAEERSHLLSSPILKAQDSRRNPLHSITEHIGVLFTTITSHPRNFSLLLLSFLLTSLASSDTKMLVQYISGRYHWTFVSAGYLLSGKSVVNLTLLAVIIPRFLRSSIFRTESVDRTNLRYARHCLAVSVVGAFGIAVAAHMSLLIPSLLIYAVGSALPIFTLSLLKSPAICPQSTDGSEAENHIFSLVMLVKTVGSLLGAPLMAILWVNGLQIGGLALGMPFFVSGMSYILAIVVSSGIRIREGDAGRLL